MTKYVTTGTLGPESVTVPSFPVKFVINLTGPGKTYTSCGLTPAGRFTGSRARSAVRRASRRAPRLTAGCSLPRRLKGQASA
jgi:hypothetical protein